MTTVNNKNYTVINIDKNQGLSQAIDKTLDLEFETNIQLSADTWQSIFDKIKEEQVEQTSKQKQFGDSDTNVNNGKHYIVQTGEYHVSNVVWDFIKQKAQEWLNAKNQQKDKASEASQTTPVAEQAPTSATTPASSEASNKRKADPAKAQVEEILQNCKIYTSDIDVNDVVNKYKAILEYNQMNGITTDQTVLENRIVNYAKGLKAHAQETRFADAWQAGTTCDTKLENEAVTTALQHQSQEEFNAAFHQAAKEYIELYDSADGDGKIDVNEFIRMEAKEQGRKLTSDEIKMLQQESVDRVAILDQNNDGKLDEDEIAAYLWAMSKINDGKEGKTADDITFDEWKTAQEAMGILSGMQSLTKENRMKTMNANTIIAKLKSQYGDIKLEDLYGADLSTYTNLTENEREQLRAGLEIYENEGFKQEMIDQYAKFDFVLKNGYEGLKRK